MKKIFLLSVFLSFYNTVSAQDSIKSIRNFAWIFNTQNTTINGISVGSTIPIFKKETKNITTNGIRIDIPGLGILAPIGNGSRISFINEVPEKYNKKEHNPANEVINGINISGGSIGDLRYNGITLGVIAQFGIENNGAALALMWNSMDRSNGLQASLLLNEALYNNGIQVSLKNSALTMRGLQIGGANHTNNMKGLQIGLYNKSKQTKGIQIGLWNVNEKRKTPIINWNFKS